MLAYNVNDVVSQMTREAVRSVAENTVGEYELILFKNGGAVLDWTIYEEGARGLQLSTDRGERLGLAEAYNLGFSKATGDVFCVLHNDVVLPKGWNVPLMEAAKKGCIAFPMVDESTSNCEHRGIPKTKEGQTTGACFMLSRESWESLHGYDEEYKGYHWEDTDLFYRAMNAGIRLVRCPVTIIHYRGATRTFTRAEGRRHFEKNMNYHQEKHGGLHAPAISETPQEV